MRPLSGRTLGLVLMVVAGLLLVSSGAQAGSVGRGDVNYDLTRWTVDGGGITHRQGSAYVLGATAGQTDAGLLHGYGTAYSLSGGFWSTLGARTRIYLPLVLREA